MTEPAPTSPTRHRLAVLAALAAFPLLFFGGAVTSKNAGLAVPDWPLSYGSINPPGWWRIDHVFYEHSHRLLGWTVGFLAIAQAVAAGFGEKRPAVRRLAYGLLVGVSIQGLLGGLRVTEISTTLALVHGCFGQLVFAAMVVMAAVSSPRWPGLTPRPFEAGGYSSRFAIATLLAVVGQLILGAAGRHLGVTVVPHVLWSLAVMAMVHAGLGRVLRSYRDVGFLRIPAVLAAILVVVQMGIGVAAWAVTAQQNPARTASLLEWAVPTLHVAVGAIILASTAVMAVVSFRVTESTVACASPQPNAPLSAR